VENPKDTIALAVEQIVQRLEELNKAEAASKSLIPPHKHQAGLSAGAGVEDVPPLQVNPLGMAKEETKMSAKCAKCGELWKEESSKCGKCGHLEKCGDIEPPLKKTSIVYAPGGPLQLQGLNPKAKLTPANASEIVEVSAEGSGGQIKKGSLKSLRSKAGAKIEKASLDMNKAGLSWSGSGGLHESSPHKGLKYTVSYHKGANGGDEYHLAHRQAGVMSPGGNPKKISVHATKEDAKAAAHEHAFGSKAGEVKKSDAGMGPKASLKMSKGEGLKACDSCGEHKAPKDEVLCPGCKTKLKTPKPAPVDSKTGEVKKSDAGMGPKAPAMKAPPAAPAMEAKPPRVKAPTMAKGGIFGKLAAKKLGKTTLQDIEPDGSISPDKQVSKSDFWSPDASTDEKLSPPKGLPKTSAAPKPQFTGADLAQAKSKMVQTPNVKPNRPGIFGKLAKSKR